MLYVYRQFVVLSMVKPVEFRSTRNVCLHVRSTINFTLFLEIYFGQLKVNESDSVDDGRFQLIIQGSVRKARERMANFAISDYSFKT